MKLYCKECQQMNCNIGELVCDDCQKEIVLCAYCGTENTKGDSIKVSIYVNHDKRELWFCSKDYPCASYYQMGAEG